MTAKPTLRPYQVDAAKALASHPGGFANFDPPGAGKTPPAVMAIPKGGQAVVVTLAGPKEQWARTVKLWRPDLRPKIIRSSRGFRWPQPGVVAILNYEIMPPAKREIERLTAKVARFATVNTPGGQATYRKLARRLERLKAIYAAVTKCAPYKGTILIADEAHRLKNHSARCTMRFREMAAHAVQRQGRVWPLTGTPQVNLSDDELWEVLQSGGLGTQAFGTHAQFKEDCKVPGVVAGKLRMVSIRRDIEVILPFLPKVTREVRVVPIGKALRDDMDNIVATLKARGVNLATATLEQIRHATEQAELKDHVSRTRSALAQAKVPAMLDFVEEMKENKVPLVVLCCHRPPIDLLSRVKGWGRISGDESAKEKDAVAQAFQRGELRGVAATFRSGGTGIDLYRGWRMLMVDYPWTPADVEQGEGRLRRFGNVNTGILVTRFVADHPLEKRVDDLVIAKAARIERNVGMSAVGRKIETGESAL